MLNNPFLTSFTLFHDKLTVVDYAKHRLKLYFAEVLSSTECSFFTIRVLRLKRNCLSVGIVDQHEDRNQPRSAFSIAYEFRGGEVKDSRNVP